MINRLSSQDWLTAFLDVLLPRKCIVCGGVLSLREKHVCIKCLGDLPRTFYSFMERNRMSERFNDLVQRDLDSRSAGGTAIPVPYSLAAALFYYRASTGYRNITKSLKYHGNKAAGRYFAEMLVEEMVASGLYHDVDAVIPVPLHWSRRWSRGYNQAEVIGRVMAKILGAELRLDVLKRKRRTRTQTKLSIERKVANVSGAFALTKNASLAGKSHILLVDDVFTTGATVHACYEVIRKIAPPPVKISVATLACVGE
ncbi:MAG: ComF family protein [Bacteroidales bacterium]|nr:ComF family protein [Bacteroidales bacterium]